MRCSLLAGERETTKKSQAIGQNWKSRRIPRKKVRAKKAFLMEKFRKSSRTEQDLRDLILPLQITLAPDTHTQH